MPMGYYYGYDYTWYLLVLPAFLLALWAQFRVKAARRPATLENILSERQLELAWEGWRRQDLIRFGMFTRAYNSRPQLPNEETGYTTVFPIPEKIRVMNTKLVQNPGY